jgi:excisionase family DNA binding protein
MLTTGQAATLCDVKPDTILKWIHGGRLQASRTPGGHFRIESSHLTALRPSPLAEAPQQADAPDAEPRLLRCWEYMARGGEIAEDCLRCASYRLRAAWCFEVRKLGCDLGQMLVYCRTACQDCVYYQRVACPTTDVLVVTVDVDLVEALNADKRQLRIQVARNGYEASALIASFRPAFAVIDQEALAAGDSGLLDCLRMDQRVRGLRIILAEQPRKPASHLPLQPGIVAVLRKPFGSADLIRIVHRYRVETMPLASPAPQTAQAVDGDV